MAMDMYGFNIVEVFSNNYIFVNIIIFFEYLGLTTMFWARFIVLFPLALENWSSKWDIQSIKLQLCTHVHSMLHFL